VKPDPGDLTRKKKIGKSPASTKRRPLSKSTMRYQEAYKGSKREGKRDPQKGGRQKENATAWGKWAVRQKEPKSGGGVDRDMF